MSLSAVADTDADTDLFVMDHDPIPVRRADLDCGPVLDVADDLCPATWPDCD